MFLEIYNYLYQLKGVCQKQLFIVFLRNTALFLYLKSTEQRGSFG